jgi:hypothetical protein
MDAGLTRIPEVELHADDSPEPLQNLGLSVACS